MVVDRDRKRFLGNILTNYILIQECVDFARLGELTKLRIGGLVKFFLDDLVAQVNTFITDIHPGAGN